MRRVQSLFIAAVVLCLSACLAAPCPASASGSRKRANTAPGDAQDAAALVRTTIQHEIKAAEEDHTRWRYKLRKQTATGSYTREVIDTDEGSVARTIAINDKPLTPEQRIADDQRLEKFLASPADQQKKRREAKQDEAQVKKMFQSFPEAFVYSYAEPPAKGAESVKLKFDPNPAYTPTSHETQVFAALTGAMTIDPVHQRIVKMDGHLMRDVKFGYGILAHLDQGGKFFMEKTRVAGDYWTLTSLKLSFRGKALMFKSLTLNEEQSFSDFHHVPHGISLKQGVEMLSKPASDSTVARN